MKKEIVKKPIVIAFIGKAGSGKTTAATLLRGFRPEKYRIINFATPLKEACRQVFHLSEKQLNGSLKDFQFLSPVKITGKHIDALSTYFFGKKATTYFKKKFIGRILFSPRDVLQFVGTDILRGRDGNIFLKFMEKEIDNKKIQLVADLRFKNEFDFFKKNKNIIFLPFFMNKSDIETKSDTSTHTSEKELLDLKHNSIQLYNNGTIMELIRLMEFQDNMMRILYAEYN